MVEELAFLIKDNLQCKHLVLSTEEVFIDFLQDDTSLDGVMELKPMNPYNRLLLHRLADIFGFSHESVGEGDDRHLILERCPETSIPSILVSDFLGQYDDYQYPSTSHQLLRRTEVSPVLKTKTPSYQYSLEEREAAYMAARERIFSMDDSEVKESVNQKPRNVPVVARRMIAHALGQRIKPHNTSVEASQETNLQSGQRVNSLAKPKDGNPNKSASPHSERKVPQKPADNKSTNGKMSQNGRNGSVCKNNLKEEHMGAAKRMFAHALRQNSGKDGLLSSSETKQTGREF